MSARKLMRFNPIRNLRSIRCFSNQPAFNFQRYGQRIGNTPLLDMTKIAHAYGLRPESGTLLLGKAEFMNPSFSMKDRPMSYILQTGIQTGELRPGMTVVCASSGNMGASAAMMCATLGYRCIIITDSKCSKEKCDHIRAYGAELIIAKPGENYMQMELDMAANDSNMFPIDQYESLKNPQAHYQTTGQEIVAQTNGQVTHIVLGASTGGTISGVGQAAKENNEDTRVILADPIGSIFAEKIWTGKDAEPQPFLVEGVGKNTVPGAMNLKVIDEVVQVSDSESFSMCRDLAKFEGLSVGGSSGMNVAAAIKVAKNAPENSVVVTLLCDLGVKYLTKIFNDQWIKENDLKIEQKTNDVNSF